VSSQEYATLIDVACLIAWLMTMLPAVLFMVREWVARRNDIFAIMTDGVLAAYYRRFYPSRNIPVAEQKATFQRDFGRAYGRRWYITPLTLLGLLSGWGLWGTSGTMKVWVKVCDPSRTYTIDAIALGAFLGGLTWVVTDHFERFRNRDFTSYDVFTGVLRLLISVPLGYSLASFGTEKLQIPIAFLLGAFPTSTIFTIARRLGSKQFGLADDAMHPSQQSELEKLQSVGTLTAERFRDEGISSIVALAWANPIDLTIRTNLPFSYVMDCVSQALLWIYLQDDVQKLFVISVRGAKEVYWLMHANPQQTQAALGEIAKRLGIEEPTLYAMFREVYYDPSTQFIVKAWPGVNEAPI
jgi:hypothetical protein